MSYKKDIKALGDAIRSTLEKSFAASQLKPAGKFIVDTIYKRVKAGGGVTDDKSDNAARKSLKKLSKNYIEQRTRYPSQGAFFSPNRSNLTRTGQMLDSMNFKVTKGKLTIFIPSSKRDDGLSNSEVAGYVRKDRPFFTLTVPEQRIVFRKIETNLRQFIRLAFKKG